MRAGKSKRTPWPVLVGLNLLLLAPHLPAAQQAGLAAHDSSLPIEVVADRLTVEQNNRIAVFSGNVEAVQGELVLRADEVRVAYAFGQERSEAAQPVERIEAIGNVIVTTPEETAEADRGIYDVVEGTMRLEGEVVLVRGDNVIEGGRLDIDLAAGRAVVTADAGTGSRVRAVFVPPKERGASE